MWIESVRNSLFSRIRRPSPSRVPSEQSMLLLCASRRGLVGVWEQARPFLFGMLGCQINQSWAGLNQVKSLHLCRHYSSLTKKKLHAQVHWPQILRVNCVTDSQIITQGLIIIFLFQNIFLLLKQLLLFVQQIKIVLKYFFISELI